MNDETDTPPRDTLVQCEPSPKIEDSSVADARYWLLVILQTDYYVMLYLRVLITTVIPQKLEQPVGLGVWSGVLIVKTNIVLGFEYHLHLPLIQSVCHFAYKTYSNGFSKVFFLSTSI